MEKAYELQKFPDANQKSKQIVLAKMTYSIMIFIQVYTDDISWVRLINYLISGMFHYYMVEFVQIYPQFQWLHTFVSNLSFVTFTLNDPEAYLHKSDHIALLLGFIANMFLSSTFVSTNWVNTLVAQSFATLLVIYFFCIRLNYEFKVAFSMILLVISCAFNSYYVEMKEKKLFYEMQQNM